MFFYCYKITNKINNKYYIGVHVTNNLNDGYMGSGKLIKKAIQKYGLECFSKEIICFCNTVEDLYQLEKEIITLELLSDKMCYNIATGGKGGWHHVDCKEGRRVADKVLEERYGKNWCSILAYKGVEINKKNKTGIFSPNHIQPFTNKEIQQLGNSPESREKARVTMKETCKRIKHQQGEKNSQYGTYWICNHKLKKIRKLKKQS